MCISVTSVFTIFRERNLTYRAWLPYDYYSSNIVFCLTYAHQLIGLTTGSLVNVGCDTLMGGLLLQICCQFEILKCRLSKISNDHDTLGDCVRHHDSIFELVFFVLLLQKYLVRGKKLYCFVCFFLSLFLIYIFYLNSRCHMCIYILVYC